MCKKGMVINMGKTINVTFWNEFRHEKINDAVKALYPDGIHAYVKSFLETNDDIKVTLASLDDPDQGLPDEVLNNTDVLLWWGHMHHGEVDDALVERIRQRVYVNGMGFVPLHSAHHSKPFKAIIGTTGNLCWGAEVKEFIWNIMPSHPIAAGVPDHFELETEEIYAEPFQIPAPDEFIFNGWYASGHVFRSGCCWRRGAGKIFYFQPGHETCPSFHNPIVQRIITNAVYWAAPADMGFNYDAGCPYVNPIV